MYWKKFRKKYYEGHLHIVKVHKKWPVEEVHLPEKWEVHFVSREVQKKNSPPRSSVAKKIGSSLTYWREVHHLFEEVQKWFENSYSRTGSRIANLAAHSLAAVGYR